MTFHLIVFPAYQRSVLYSFLIVYFLTAKKHWNEKKEIIPTVGENIIAIIKMQNNFCYSLKMVIF